MAYEPSADASGEATCPGGGGCDEKELEYPLSPPSWVPEARDGLLTEPFLQTGGELEVPRRPGLGFEIDRRALRRYGKRFFVMDRLRFAWFGLRDRGLKAALEIDRTKREERARRRPSISD